MNQLFTILITSIVLLSCAANVEEDLIVDVCVPEKNSFSTDIYPILLDRCINCHKGPNPQSGINYETYEDVLSTVVAGKPEQSLLYGTISYDFGTEMPYLEDQLSECEIEKIKNWILNGAKND